MAATNLIVQIPDANDDGKELAWVKEWLGVPQNASIAVTSAALTAWALPLIRQAVREEIVRKRTATARQAIADAEAAANSELGASEL